MNERALKYLLEKQTVKGKEIVYQKIEIAEYLSPSNSELTIEERRKLFGIRNDMILMNLSKPKMNKICSCGIIENLEHIYSCKSLNSKKIEVPFQDIYSKNTKNQINTFSSVKMSCICRKTKIPCAVVEKLLANYH